MTPASTGEQIAAMNKTISDLQASGGQIAASFGGVAGTELAEACGSVISLKAAYRTVIEKYSLTRIDFDIEGGAQADHAAATRRGQAIALLQADAAAAGKTLTTTFTVPVIPTGLTAEGLGVLQDTAKAGARIDLVNVITIDYGQPNSNMGQAAIDAATNTASQVGFLYPGMTTSQRIERVGITPMIGVNDDPGEIFTASNARQVATWAKANGLGEIAWWALQRGTACPKNGSYVNENYSGTSDAA